MSYETEKVQPSVCVFGSLEAREDGLVFVKLALLNRNVDPDDILPHDAPCTNIQMSVYPPVSGTLQSNDGGQRREDRPDFRISHEPIRKPDCYPMSSKCAVRIFLRDGVHVRRRARFDGIALQTFLVSDTPTVVHTVPTQNHVRIGGQFT
jgi:hypothetical protein